MESGDGTVTRNPVRNGPARYFHAVFGRDAAHGLSLRMAEVVKAQGSGDDARRIFHAFQTGKGRKVLAAVLTEVKLKMPETVLAQAALDNSSPIASRAEVWLGLDGRTLGQRSFD